jgi:hypothetical protein
MVQMPDHGEIQLDSFQNYELGFSGHFHKRQQRQNMIYIGNAFPHNYADAWDDERGMMILEWGGTPEYINWPNIPRYRVFKLDQLLDNMEKRIKPKMHLRVNMNIDLSHNEAKYIKELAIEQYGARECSMLVERKDLEGTSTIEITQFETVDQIVTNQLINIESENFDSNVLLGIYNSL